MKKIVAISDIHGFCSLAKEAVYKTGFKDNDKDWLLVCCGDYFDRGIEPNEVIEWLSSLNNVVLVSGNHEYLMEKMLKRGYPTDADYHNGTLESAVIIQDRIINKKNNIKFVRNYDIIKPVIEKFYSKMVTHFETKNYIFVHSWIPFDIIVNNAQFEPVYSDNWKNASNTDWDEAMWGNPFEYEAKGINKTGKILVHGHWHNSVFWADKENRPEFGKEAKFDIAYHGNCIGLDACTAYSRKVNTLVIEDDLINDKD